MPKKKNQPVANGSVFAAFMNEAILMSKELGARRSFCDDVAAFLKQKKLTEEFEAFRTRE